MRAISAHRQGAAESGGVRISLALRFLALPVLSLGTVLLASSLEAQDTGRTVRHHRVAEQDPSFPPELSQAEDAIAKKDFAAAEPLLKTVVERDASNFQAWFDLGYVDNALGRQDDAIAAYRKSVAAKPDVFESNLNLGLMLAQRGQPGAEPFLRAATKLRPTAEIDEGHARAWMGLAHVLEASDPAAAEEAYLQVATLRPKDPEPRLSAGLLLEKQNRFADAEQQYRQALALNPASPDALTALGNLYMRGRRLGEAEDMLRKLLVLHPEDPGAHIQLGRMLAADGQNDAAIAELQATLKMAPHDLGVQRDLADLYAITGKYDLAQAGYQALLGSNPKDPDLHYRLGQALLRQHKFPPAQQEFLTAAQLKPDFGAAYGDLAVAANENKNYVEVIAALDARAKFLPEIPIGYFLRATAYDHLRNYKLAAVNYHKFLAVANGQFPDNEWQARHRLIAIEPKK
jgi:tetratricopeptide (TPR) repeat protein